MLKTVTCKTQNLTNNQTPQNKNTPAQAATQPLNAAPAPLGRGAYGVTFRKGPNFQETLAETRKLLGQGEVRRARDTLFKLPDEVLTGNQDALTLLIDIGLKLPHLKPSTQLVDRWRGLVNKLPEAPKGYVGRHVAQEPGNPKKATGNAAVPTATPPQRETAPPQSKALTEKTLFIRNPYPQTTPSNRADTLVIPKVTEPQRTVDPLRAPTRVYPIHPPHEGKDIIVPLLSPQSPFSLN